MINKMLSDPTIVRKYFYEITLSGLTAAVVYLFWQIISLNEFIRNDAINGRQDNVRVIERNNTLIQENNFILKQLKFRKDEEENSIIPK